MLARFLSVMMGWERARSSLSRVLKAVLMEGWTVYEDTIWCAPRKMMSVEAIKLRLWTALLTLH